MFTIEQIKKAHAKVKTGADFPDYIREITSLGVMAFETWVNDSHTDYFGEDGYCAKSLPMYDALFVAETSNEEKFKQCLQAHQQGKTNYLTFCSDCAECGIEKWFVSLKAMTCTYYNKKGEVILVEHIPG